MGISTKPEAMILTDATWKAFNPNKPAFIKIKLLPQIKDKNIKRNTLPHLISIALQFRYKSAGIEMKYINIFHTNILKAYFSLILNQVSI